MTHSETHRRVPACTEKNDKMWKKDEKIFLFKVYDSLEQTCRQQHAQLRTCAVAGLF